MHTETRAQQLRFRLEHKVRCFHRAIEDSRIDEAQIFLAQAAWFERELLGEQAAPLTERNRNHCAAIQLS